MIKMKRITFLLLLCICLMNSHLVKSQQLPLNSKNNHVNKHAVSGNAILNYKMSRLPKINNHKGLKSTPISTYYIDYATLAQYFTANTGSYVWEYKSNPTANDTLMTKIGMSLYYSTPAARTPDSIIVFDDYNDIPGSTKFFSYPSSITIDSVFFFNTHVNNSGLKDSIEWNIVGLSGTGTPQLNTVMARGGLSTTTSLSPGGHWLGSGSTVMLPFAVNYTSTVPVGITELFYAGASNDTFSQLISYVDDGSGGAAQYSSLPFSFYNYVPFINNLARNTSISAGGNPSELEDWQTVVRVTFQEPLSAGFTYSRNLPPNNMVVNFSAFANDPTVSFSWDFGDGSPLVGGMNPTHIYVNPGLYQVNMTATSAAGTVNVQKKVQISNYSIVINHNITICQGDTYPWNGQLLNSPVIDTVHLVNYLGGDSLDILNLSILPTTSKVTNASICFGSGFIWNSQVYHNSVIDTFYFVNSYGCDSIDILNLIVNPLPIVGIQMQGVNPICLGQSISLYGTGAAQYYWNQGIINGQAFVPSQTATYTVTGIDLNGCTNTSNISVTVLNVPTSQMIIGNPSIVPFQNYTYAVSATPGYNYTWIANNGAIVSGQGTNSINVMWGNTGPYSVQLITSNGAGCSDTAYMVVINSNCSLNYNVFTQTKNPLCQGDSILLNVQIASPSTYQWFYNSQMIAGATNDSIWVHSSGTYQVQITSGNCSVLSNGTNLVFAGRPPLPSVLSIDSIGNGCGWSKIVLGVNNSANTYLWSNGNQTPTDTVTLSGNYSVQVFNAAGCSNTSSSFAVNMSGTSTPNVCLVTVDSATGKNLVIWEKASKIRIDSFVIYKEQNQLNNFVPIAHVSVNAMSTYLDNNSTPAQQADRYKIAILDSCGVEGLLSTPHKTIHLTINQGLGSVWNLIWTPYEGISFASYKIYREDANGVVQLLNTVPSNITSYTDVNPPSGVLNYYVTVVHPNGCTPTQKQASTIESSSNRVSIQSNTNIAALNFAQINVYPNPATSYLIIDAVPMQVEVQLTDLLGQCIQKKRLQAGRNQMDISSLAAGVYLLHIGNTIKRVVVTKG